MNDKYDARFRKVSRAEMIHELVRTRIARGVWRPGDKIDDRLLTDELGVSRLSVREALSRLVATGVLVRESWKGYRLRNLDKKADIDSILDVRLSLEELAIRGAMANCSNEMLAELEEAITLSTEYRQREQIVEFRRSDTRFHEILYRESGNPWIETVLGNLRPLIDAIWCISQDDEFGPVTDQSLGEHRAILEALKSGSEQRALKAMRTHMANHRSRAHNHLQCIVNKRRTNGT